MTTTEQRTPVQPGTARWDELVIAGIIKDQQRNWFLGDAALEIAPMGTEGGTGNGRDALLAAYADEIGINANSLRWYRDVAYAWPTPDRSGVTSHKVHAMFMGRDDSRKLIEADGPGVRITVTRAHELLGQATAGRTGPRSSPEAQAAQARKSMADPRVLDDVVDDDDTRAMLLAHPSVLDEITARADALAAQLVADAREQAAQALVDAQAASDRALASAPVTDDAADADAVQAALDEAAERIASLTAALDRAQTVNGRIESDRAATKAQRDEAHAAMLTARKTLTEERKGFAAQQAELTRLREDPDRVVRASAGRQYAWIVRGLQTAQKALSEVDNQLDAEPCVLTGDLQESVLQVAANMSLRLSAISSKLGGDWTAHL